MNRFTGLWRDTWWVWSLFAAIGVVASFLSPIFLVIFPISIFAFFYFAAMRYDEDGNEKEM